jgi:hypothetical protein
MAEHGAHPTIIVLPLAARPRTMRSLSEFIADEVRRDAAARVGVDAGGDDQPAADPDLDDPPKPAADLNSAVIAAHDERIACLQRQIAIHVTDGGSKTQVGFLLARLHRAQAARRVAALRSGVASPPDAAQPSLALAAAKPAPHRLAAGATARVGAGALPRSAGVLVAATPGSTASPNPHRTETSRHVRRLLATARQALEGADPVAGSAAPARPISLAGLMQWEGSDTWSLADCPRFHA